MKEYRKTLKEYRNSEGQLHREDGPAIEYDNGDTQWWVHGNLHRENGPSIANNDGSYVWFLHGTPHRESGPAWRGNNGDEEWYKNGLLHRENGPALEYANGAKYFYVFDVEILDEIDWFDKGYLTDEEKTFLVLKYR